MESIIGQNFNKSKPCGQRGVKLKNYFMYPMLKRGDQQPPIQQVQCNDKSLEQVRINLISHNLLKNQFLHFHLMRLNKNQNRI